MKYRLFKPSFLVIFSIGLMSLGFSSWIIGNNNRTSSNLATTTSVGDFYDRAPLKFVSVSTNTTFTSSGLYTNNYENIGGVSYKYLKPNGQDFRIRYYFDLDNSKYKYDIKSGETIIHFICLNAEMKITGITSPINDYFGLPHQSGNDLCVLENDAGWWQKNGFSFSRYDSRSQSQIITTGDHNMGNKTPTSRKTRFFLEYCFKDFSKIVSNRPINFELKVNLRYNQV